MSKNDQLARSKLTRTRELVLVGGGHTHVQVLRRFAMEPPEATHVTVVLDRPVAVYSGMVPGFVAGQYEAHELEIDVVPLARRAGARVILSPATGLERDEKRLILDNRPSIPYDFLSFDVGSTVAGLSVPGVTEFALPTRPISTLVRRIDDVLAKARQHKRDRFRVVVVGGGAGGVEMAFTLERRLRQVRGSPVDVTLLDNASLLLRGFPERLAKKVEGAAKRRSIEITLSTEVESIDRERVLLRGGGELPADLVVWVTGAAPRELLGEIDVAKDERGFLLTRPTLQLKDHDDLFAVGDCATLEATPTPKAGVYAVRQGPFLTDNLRAALAGEPLRDYRPQRDFLTLLNLGDGTAVGAKRGLVFAGRWVMRLKDRIDRRFMRRFQVLDGTGVLSEEFRTPMTSEEPMLCGGCAAKLGQSALERALARLPAAPTDQEVTLGLDRPDDAAAFKTPRGDEVFVTIDAFRAFTDDPYLVGQVAALNALSDLYAKGVEPRFALALVTLPDPRFTLGQIDGEVEIDDAAAEEILVQALAGARNIFDEHGVSLIGGHTTTGPELVVGFSVQGVRTGERVLLLDGAQPGDRLLLTQPLGTGVLLHADMVGRARGEWVRELFQVMLRSAKDAAQQALEHDARAATDVTGFGLASHLADLLRADGLGATVSLSAVPSLAGANELLAQGLRSTSHAQNAAHRRGLQISAALAGNPRVELLFDPQTAGGLLLSVDSAQADHLLSSLKESGYRDAAIIGSIDEGGGEGDADQQGPGAGPRIRIEP